MLHYLPKLQDVFGCIAEILGCPSRRGKDGQSPKVGSLEKAQERPDLQKGHAVWAYNETGDFVAFLVRDLSLLIINPSVAQ